jgi:hypothetical protein
VIGLCVQRLESWSLPLFSIGALYLAAGACWLAVDPEQTLARDAG